jgi:ubiquinone biosynthesis protein
MRDSTLPRFSSVRRLGEVVGILTKYGLADWLSGTELERSKQLFVGREGQLLAHESHATRIRLAATELGTTFIKLGQMLSTRPDLVGADVADELTKLQEQVPADGAEVVVATIRAELGSPVEEIFASFDPVPLGSASIAQVHRAQLFDGTEVVVKVQHPGIEPQIRADLAILHKLAVVLERSARFSRFQPLSVVQEFRRSIMRELNFAREERNLQQFATNFAGDPTVRFPRAISELCTVRVLTMEMLSGARVQEAEALAGIDVSGEQLARHGARIWMNMVFRDGFFHADPHAGNLLVLPGGVIGILDCGMVERLEEALRDRVEESLVAVAERDAERLARVIMQVCATKSDIDEASFVADAADYVSFYGNQRMEKIHLGSALSELMEILSRYQLVLPTGVSKLIKTFAMLEGTARILHPGVNLLELVAEYRPTLMRMRFSPQRRWRKWQRSVGEWRQLAAALPGDISDIVDKIQRGKLDIHLEHRRLEPFVNRLAMGIVTSALLVSSAMLLGNRVPPEVGGYSLGGIVGVLLSLLLGGRLVGKIWRE